ncbi:MAG: ComE operon protein 2 [Acetilactobacillus jinshanensis]
MAKNDPRIPWDQFFMLQAVLLSTRSTCNRLSVGAVLVKDRRIIAEGYNGSVSGDYHCTDKGCYMVNGHCLRTIHAEQNAIVQCAKFGESMDGAQLYVTDFPCLQCTKMLLQGGITEINYLRNYHDSPYAKHLIKLKHIKLKQIPLTMKTIEQIPFKSYLSK